MAQKTREIKIRSKLYDPDTHDAWINKNNQGLLHFGIDPNHLQIDNLRFDVFHLTCAITKRVLLSLITFILKRFFEVTDRCLKEGL